jgi:hypothetical protein
MNAKPPVLPIAVAAPPDVRPAAGDTVLSVRQPFAWLIVHGFKPYENRSWNTNFRGRLWIHASTRRPAISDDEVREELSMTYGLPPDLAAAYRPVYGAIIGAATVAEVFFGHSVPRRDLGNVHVDESDYHWLLENPAVLRTPVVMTGRVGLFKV